MQSSKIYLFVSMFALVGLAHTKKEHPTLVLWGDTHIHTALSGDAFSGGVRLDPDVVLRTGVGTVKTERAVQIPDFLRHEEIAAASLDGAVATYAFMGRAVGTDRGVTR